MAQFVDGGSLMFDSLAYGKSHPGTQNFLASQFENVTNVLNQAGQQFFSGVYNLYDQLSGSTAARMLRAAGRSVRSIWQLDEIRPLSDIGALQQAPLTMQRWIMAEPMVRSLFHKQRVDGYSDTYQDTHPDEIGPDHYDYRRVMNGVVVFDDEPDADGNYNWKATTYFDELYEDDSPLTLEEQVDILDTWEHIRAHLRAGADDPTSRYNASL